MTRSDRWLTLLLRVGAILTGLAVFTIGLPEEWMAATHRDLGLGEFPAAPITDYLTRSLSAMYAFHGLVLLALSLDVRRYLPAIAWIGWGTVTMGMILAAIDLHAPMPRWWTLTEGPGLLVAGLLVVWLARGVKREAVVQAVEGRIPLKK